MNNEDNSYLIPFILDLLNVKKTTDVVPDYIPKKFIDQFSLYYKDGVFGFYVYIDNTWKNIVNITSDYVANSEVSETSEPNKIPRANGDGKLDIAYLIKNSLSGLEYDTGLKIKINKGLYIDGNGLSADDQSSLMYFGDGSDGDVVISTNTTLNTDKYYKNLTIQDGITLNPNGYRIFVLDTTTFIGTGKIARNGNDAVGNGGGAPLADGTIKGAFGGGDGGSGGEYSGGGSNGYPGTNGSSANPSLTAVDGANGGKGGDAYNSSPALLGGRGGYGGTSTSENASFEIKESFVATITLNSENVKNIRHLAIIKGSTSGETLSTSSASGGGGGGATVNNEAVAGLGGGGGGNGGTVYLASSKIVTIEGNDFIQVKGGNGANGGNASNTVPMKTGGGGGGGGGGQGGLAIAIYNSLTGNGTINISGGIAGQGGLAAQNNPATDKNGHAGTNGNAGKYIKIKIN